MPLLLPFYPWQVVFVALLGIDLLWVFIQYAFVSVRLSQLSCLFVVWLKWPAVLGSAIALFMHGRHGLGVVAVLWPLLAGVVGDPAGMILGFLGLRRSLGSISLALAKQIGCIDQDAQL